MKTKIFGFMVAILLGVLLLPLAGNAITVSPPIIEIEAVRGDVISQILKVRNENTSAVTYYLSAERFIAGGEEGQPQFIGEDIGLSTWLNFPVDSVTIPGGETVEIPFTIAIPNFAGPGGHYAAIFLSTLPPDSVAGGSQVSIAQKIGTLVLVRIAGDIKEGSSVAEFEAVADTFDSLPVDFNLRIENTGNVHVKPMGTILLKNMFGSVAGQVAVNETGGNVLPDQIRKFTPSWVKNPNAVGASSFWGKYREQRENYAFGKYNADLTLAYGTAGKVLTGDASFWVIPWNIIIVNLIILVILVVILYYLVKKYNAWLLTKYGKKSPKSAKK